MQEDAILTELPVFLLQFQYLRAYNVCSFQLKLIVKRQCETLGPFVQNLVVGLMPGDV